MCGKFQLKLRYYARFVGIVAVKAWEVEIYSARWAAASFEPQFGMKGCQKRKIDIGSP